MANPVVPATLDDGGGDQNTDPKVTTLETSQATNSYAPEQTGTGELRRPRVELDAVDYDPNSIGTTGYEEEATASELAFERQQFDLDPNSIGATGYEELATASELAFERQQYDLDPNSIGASGYEEYASTSELEFEAATARGAGANDDGGTPSAATTTSAANTAGSAASTGKITPQPNILDRFATYNYQASVYLMSPTQYKTYMETGKRQITGYNLLFQSGGAPNNVGGPQGGTGTNASGRNPFFRDDFYIDSITLNNSLFGKATTAAHGVVDMKFTVIEPANITLIDCLYNAVQDMKPKMASGAVNYAAAVYLMVIRFYGQDITGKMQLVGAADPQSGLSDANAIVEKFIPFKIKELKFSIGSKAVTYEFDCAPVGQLIGTGTRRGTIPADIELTATTVNNMLTGPAQYSTATAPAANPGASTAASQAASNERGQPGAAAAPANASTAPNNTTSIKGGLVTAMNEYQQQLVKDKQYEQADVYEIVFAPGAEAIRDGKIPKPGESINKAATAPAAPASKNPSQISPDKTSVNVSARNLGITAGMQMVQVIDLIIRNSTYISDQAVTIIDEKTGKQVASPNSNTKGMKWFSILMSATQLEYDNIRNDFAYKIKYTIVPYIPTDFQSTYFPSGQFRGVHKKYPWWFTGQNTQVLDYSATFNKLYTLTVTGSSPQDSQLALQRKQFTSSNREMPFVQYQARSTESAQGAAGKANELAASAAEYLYHPTDNAGAKVRILGDPAWIQQGSLSGVFGSQPIKTTPFLPDGTINFDLNDVLFELVWQKPEDYDSNTGLADPYAKTQKTVGDRGPIQSVLYRVKSVLTEFKQGRFEQTLDAILYIYSTPAASAKGSGSESTDSTVADSNRTPLANQTTAGGQRTSGDQYADGQSGSSATTSSEAARLEQAGGPGAIVDNADPNSLGLTGYEEEASASELAFDRALANPTPAESDGAVISDGVEVGTGTGEAIPVAGRITEDQRAEINRRNAVLQNTFGITVLSGTDSGPTNTAPQIMARDY